MRSQTAIASKRNIRYQPYAFTEHGVAMLSAVLKSDRAVRMSIFIVRAFVQLRELPATNKELARKVEQLEAVSRRNRSPQLPLAQWRAVRAAARMAVLSCGPFQRSAGQSSEPTHSLNHSGNGSACHTTVPAFGTRMRRWVLPELSWNVAISANRRSGGGIGGAPGVPAPYAVSSRMTS
jgi:hypothetical protein